MNILWYGLKVAAVGIIVVFVGLVILIGCIKVLNLLGSRRKDSDEATQAAPAMAATPALAAPVPQAPRAYVPGPRITRKDDAFYAVVTGAIAQVLATEGVNPEGGFAIRSIKTVSEPTPGPALTTKDDALYAVVTGAIAKTLEAEGVNPEGGFAIRSVKPV